MSDTGGSNNMVRTTISIRAMDEKWLREQHDIVSGIIGMNVGMSFIFRLMIKYFIVNKLSLKDYRTILGANITKTDE